MCYVQHREMLGCVCRATLGYEVLSCLELHEPLGFVNLNCEQLCEELGHGERFL